MLMEIVARAPGRGSVDFTPAAQVIADSLSPAGNRLTTLTVRMHRFVLAEFNTHRAFSRNSASSRAIPVHKTLARLADEPVYPLAWPREHKGMQGGRLLPSAEAGMAQAVWLAARDCAVDAAHRLLDLGVHKSVVNRLLEPFMTHTVIVTATDWDNFWDQRCSPLAQPELRAVAEAMCDAYDASTPRPVDYDGWHLPYIADELVDLGLEAAKRISAARCARVSYLTHDGRRDVDADLALYDRLVTADPPHASPLEHVATPTPLPVGSALHRGNYTGWARLRHKVFGR